MSGNNIILKGGSIAYIGSSEIVKGNHRGMPP